MNTFDASRGYPAGETKPVIHVPVLRVTRMQSLLAVRLPDLMNALEIAPLMQEAWAGRQLNNLIANVEWWQHAEGEYPANVWVTADSALVLCRREDTQLAKDVAAAIRENAQGIRMRELGMKSVMDFTTVRGIEELYFHSAKESNAADFSLSDILSEVDAGGFPPDAVRGARAIPDPGTPSAAPLRYNGQAALTKNGQYTFNYRSESSSGIEENDAEESMTEAEAEYPPALCIQPAPRKFSNRWPLSTSAVAQRFGLTPCELNYLLLQGQLIRYSREIGFHMANPKLEGKLAIRVRGHHHKGEKRRDTLYWTRAGYARVMQLLAKEACYPVVEEETEVENGSWNGMRL